MDGDATRRRHMCMVMRGVERVGAKTVTTSYFGCFKEDASLRAEFLTQVRDGRR